MTPLNITDCDLYKPLFIQIVYCFILKSCSKVLLPEEDKILYLNQLKKPGITSTQRKAIHKKVLDKCKKITKCPYCQDKNGKYYIRLFSFFIVLCKLQK